MTTLSIVLLVYLLGVAAERARQFKWPVSAERRAECGDLFDVDRALLLFALLWPVSWLVLLWLRWDERDEAK